MTRKRRSNNSDSSSSASTAPSSTTKKSSMKRINKTKEPKKQQPKSSINGIVVVCVLLAFVFAALITLNPAPQDDKQQTDNAKLKQKDEVVSTEEEQGENTKVEEEDEIASKTTTTTITAEERILFAGEEYYNVLEVIPHQPSRSLFTQGLTYHNGLLYEGTGINGESALYTINPSSGAIVKRASLEKRFFGEGIAFYHNDENQPRIIQITWREQTGFIYDADTFDVVHEFEYDTSTSEGWGITYHPEWKEFVVSDGSSNLMFWDRDTLVEKRRVEVWLPFADEEGRVMTPPKKARTVKHINELEWYKGDILANVWYNDVIIRIDPLTGSVRRVYDFKSLYTDRDGSEDCFNGISVSDVEGELFVTGKWWPSLYRIKLLD
uniref:Glutamine cyclotransferase n=2 Tax=Ditylum brightwellii TaxID=49249 RepID=A0A7S4WIL9_9STRA